MRSDVIRSLQVKVLATKTEGPDFVPWAAHDGRKESAPSGC